jgi:cold shock CspA family protein
MNTIHQGIVEQFNPRKQWGFVRDIDGTKFFFHLDNCAKGFTPRLGMDVEYVVGPAFTLGKPDQALDVCATTVQS